MLPARAFTTALIGLAACCATESLAGDSKTQFSPTLEAIRPYVNKDMSEGWEIFSIADSPNNHFVYLTNRKDFERQGTLLKVWVRAEYGDPVVGKKSFAYLSEMERWAVDCEAKQLTLMSEITYASNGAAGSQTSETYDLNTQKPIDGSEPTSNAGLLLSFACPSNASGGHPKQSQGATSSSGSENESTPAIYAAIQNAKKEGWTVVASNQNEESGETVIMANESAIYATGNELSAWIYFEYRGGKTVQPSSQMEKWVFKCETLQTRTLTVATYPSNGLGSTPSTWTNSNPKWDESIPGTVGEGVAKFVCSKAARAQRKKPANSGMPDMSSVQ